MHSSGSPFSSPDGNFYSQGVGSTFHPCGAKAAQLLGPWSFLMYGLVLEAEKMGFEGLQSGDEATLASHAKPQNTELVNEGYFIFSYSLPSLSKKSGGPNHFHSSVWGHSKRSASFSTATGTGNAVITRADWLVETDRMIYFDNASYGDGCICETLDSFFLLLFLNTVPWSTFS